MNFNELVQCTEDQSDFERLIKLCSEYGLNEEQTNQIIKDFKDGLLCANQQSIQESFQQSFREISCLDEDSRREEYSFKYYQQKLVAGNQDSLDEPEEKEKKEESQHYTSREHSITKQCAHVYEMFLKERRDFENNIYLKMQEENKKLKEQIEEKNTKIDLFMKMKVQDSDIILGLKDAISNLTSLLQEKDHQNQQLHEKCQKLQKQQQIQESKVNPFHQQSIAQSEGRKSIQEKDRRKSINTAILRETQQQDYSKRLQKKQSKKYIRQGSNKNVNRRLSQMKTVVESKENRDNFRQQKNKRQNKIDISKYKGMIEELRNSYCQFR